MRVRGRGLAACCQNLVVRLFLSDSCREESPVEEVAEDADESDGESPPFVAFDTEQEESEGDGSEEEVWQVFSDIKGQDERAQRQDEPAVEDGATEDSSCCQREGFASDGNERCNDFGQRGAERENRESDERFGHSEHSREALSSCDNHFRVVC